MLLLGAILTFIFINKQFFQVPETEFERITKIKIEPGSITDYVRGCIDQVSRPLIFEIADKGGTFIPSTYGNVTYDAYESYHNVPNSYMTNGPVTYTFICHWEDGYGCVSNLITRQTIEAELNQNIREKLGECLNLAVFEGQGWEFTAGELKVDTTVGVDEVNIILDYPLTFRQGEKTLTFTQFDSEQDVPLGRALDLAVQIQNKERVDHYFEPYQWMLDHGVDMKIYKHQPYPHIIYQIAKKIDRTGEILRFNFALQGKDTIAEIGEERPPLVNLGWCYFPEDSNCYTNAHNEDCTAKGGIFSISQPDDCRGVTSFVQQQCIDGSCDDCSSLKHGESICQYDSVVSLGFDYVGSRHFLRTCVDGEIFYEECRDYREEVCVSWLGDDDLRKSTCKTNQWERCASQNNPLSCEMAGDCYWAGWLYKPTGLYGLNLLYFIKVDGGAKVPDGIMNADDITRPYQLRKCIPINPPGFKHWAGDGASVCAMANMIYDGDEDSSEIAFAESSTSYCYFLGDCGNYWNIADQYTNYGFLNSDTLMHDKKVRPPHELFPGMPFMADLGMFGIVRDPDKINRTPLVLDGNQVPDVSAAFSRLLSAYGRFWTRAAREYTKSNFENHVKKHIANLDFPIDTHYGIRHISICSVYGAPKNPFSATGEYDLLPTGGMMFQNTPAYPGVQMCDFCNTDLENENKPCSEYRCLSLGRGCIFSYENGRGVCRAANEQDRDPPNVMIDDVEITDGDYTLETDFTPFTVPPRDFEGVRICHGDCADDDGQNDGIQPYTTLNVRVPFDEDVQCKLSYYPSFDYGDIPILFVTMAMAPIPVMDSKDLAAIFGSEYKRVMNIDLPVYPDSEVTKDIFTNDIDNIFELLYTPMDIQSSMMQIVKGYTQVSGEAGDQMDSQILQQWVMDFERFYPKIQQSVQEARSAMSFILQERAKGNILLFFDCIDRNGNANRNFYLKFAVAPDRTPAKLLYSEPEDNATLPDSLYSVVLHLNEPADCKMSVGEDAAYEDMPYYMDCQVRQTESIDKTFQCTADLLAEQGLNTLYFKCMDQPFPIRDYKITLIEAEESGIENIDEYNPWLNLTVDGNNIYFEKEDLLANEPRVKVTGDAVLSMKLYGDSVCRYTTEEDVHFLDIPASQSFSCSPDGNYVMCTSALKLQSPDVTYHIKCVDSEIFSAARNTNPQSFVLTYTR